MSEETLEDIYNKLNKFMIHEAYNLITRYNLDFWTIDDLIQEARIYIFNQIKIGKKYNSWKERMKNFITRDLLTTKQVNKIKYTYDPITKIPNLENHIANGTMDVVDSNLTNKYYFITRKTKSKMLNLKRLQKLYPSNKIFTMGNYIYFEVNKNK